MDGRPKKHCECCNKDYNEYHYLTYHLKTKYHKRRYEVWKKENQENKEKEITLENIMKRLEEIEVKLEMFFSQ